MIYLMLSFLTINCRFSENDVQNSKSEVIKTKDEIFEDKLKNEPKIFLKYWSNMNQEEFIRISRILEKEGLVKIRIHNRYYIDGYDVFYNLGDSELEIAPTIYEKYNGKSIIKKSKGIVGIKLTGFVGETYNIFKEKYNLLEYKEKNLYSFYIEDNPLYFDFKKGVFNTTNRNKIGKKEIDDFTGGKENFLKWGEENNLKYNNIYLTEDYKIILTPKDVVIKKDNVTILIENHEFNYGNESYTYKENDTKNSKKRLVSVPYSYKLVVTYFPKSFYDKIESNNKIIENQNKIKVENEKKLKEKRKVEISNEI